MPIEVGLSFGLSIFLRSASVLVSHHIPWVGDLVCQFIYMLLGISAIFFRHFVIPRVLQMELICYGDDMVLVSSAQDPPCAVAWLEFWLSVWVPRGQGRFRRQIDFRRLSYLGHVWPRD